MPSNSVCKLGVRWPSAMTAVLDIKVTGAGASDTNWKKMSDDSGVTFPLNVTASTQPYIYTNFPGSYDISFKVLTVEIAAPGNTALVRQFNQGEGFVFAPSFSSLSPLTVANVATHTVDGTYGLATAEGDVIIDLRTKLDQLKAILASQGEAVK